MVEIPASLQMWFWTALGAGILFIRWSATSHLEAWGLSMVLRRFFEEDDGRLFAAVEILLFVGIGCAAGTALAQPSTPAQAITAGFGWTAFFTNPVSLTDGRRTEGET